MDALLDKLAKSNDVDAKVDALAKLQLEFEKGPVQPSDPEGYVSVLKACLRTSNLHLTNATLSALPAILPVLLRQTINSPQQALGSSTSTSTSPSSSIDVYTLRQALTAFLPAGGLIDRLGDKERAQAKAREALVILGGYSFRSSPPSTLSSKLGKGPEPPIAIFERAVRDSGLGSKVWKVREQAIQTLVHLRRAHHLFPIRPYLTSLVDCLEDTDPHVRECARTSIVELFSGPGVTDAARADLKKEMSKKGVRKAIVDGVLSKLLASQPIPGSQAAEQTEDTAPAPKEYIPPSLALQGKRPRLASQSSATNSTRVVSQSAPKEIPRPVSRSAMVSPPPMTPSSDSADVQPAYIASARDLESEFAAMVKPFEGKETEHNWSLRETAIQRVRGMLKGEAHLKYPDVFIAALKDGFIQNSLKTLASLRTTVATNTCILYSELAVALGPALDPFCEVLFSNLLKMAAFTKKITAQLSQAAVGTIITYTSAQPRTVIPLLWQTLQEKTVQARAFVVGHLKTYLEVHGQKAKAALEASGTLDVIEKSLKKALADPNPAVRENARTTFWTFMNIWEDHGRTIMDTLDPTARKQLERACPSATAQNTVPSTPQPPRKSSVAAAIAASRAKAKAIATAPPTLRHQATSRAAPPVARTTSPSISPANFTARPDSPLRNSTTSPTPSRPRLSSSSAPRSSSNPTIAGHARKLSSGSDKIERARSPSLSDSGVRRLLSSTAAPAPVKLHRVSTSPRTTTKTSPPRVRPVPAPSLGGTSAGRSSLNQMLLGNDESLLLAQSVPVPEDDSDMDDHAMSSPVPPAPMSVQSQDTTLSPLSISNALSSGSISDLASQQPVVEDALRARAEQAESAAERLLELVEPEDTSTPQPVLPLSLLRTTGNGSSSTKIKVKPIPLLSPRPPPVTPKANRTALIMKQAALFADSPAPAQKSLSLLDVLQTQKQETGWWLKRKLLLSQKASLSSSISNPIESVEETITALDSDRADLNDLKRLALLCMDYSVNDLSSPPLSPRNQASSPTLVGPGSDARAALLVPSSKSIWEQNKLFDRLFNSLTQYLQPTKSEEELAHGLIVLWEMITSLAPCAEGKEGDVFSTTLRVRSSNKVTVLEGSNAIRDALSAKLDPVYGLITMHASLRFFQADPSTESTDSEIKAATFAFGLMALGKFILRLPAEIAEEELPRLKGTLIRSLNDKTSLIVRESAAACIIAAQIVLRDETHLFTLLDGLPDDKKNLLTYLFDKHGVRDSTVSQPSSGIDKLEKEIRRLDTRTSTPLRGGL